MLETLEEHQGKLSCRHSEVRHARPGPSGIEDVRMLKIFYTSDFSNSLSILSGSYLFTYLDLPIYLIYYLLTIYLFSTKIDRNFSFRKIR